MKLIIIFVMLGFAVFGYSLWQEIKFQEKLSGMAREIKERERRNI